jgi:hypothetical protein
MTVFDKATLIIYTMGSLGWFYLWHKLIGPGWLSENRALYIAYFGAVFVFLVNIILSFYGKTPDYATELNIYSYVEKNANIVAGFSLAIAIFVFFKYNQEDKVLESKSSIKFIFLLFCSFLFSVVGCLPLYWIPPIDGWLTILRHVKTVPFTYSLFLLAAAIIIFISETHKIDCDKAE